MDHEALPEGPPGKDPVHIKPEENVTLRALAVCLAFVLASLWLLLSVGPSGLLQQILGILALAFFGFLTVVHLFNLAKGKRLGGLFVNGNGIDVQTSYSPIGRVFWHEIKAVYPVRRSFFPGFSKDLPLIGLDVTDSYVRKQSAGKRFNFWLSRHLFRAPDIQIPSKNLIATQERILRVLQDGLRHHELRSISEAKELESG